MYWGWGGDQVYDAQELQVELEVGPEPLVLQTVEGDVDMGDLVQQDGPQGRVVLLLLVEPTRCRCTLSIGWCRGSAREVEWSLLCRVSLLRTSGVGRSRGTLASEA